MGRKRNPSSTTEPTSGPESSPPSRKRIFISYARVDPDLTLAAALKVGLEGHEVFIDVAMEVGRNWDESIPKEIARSDFFILLLSEAANRSKFVKTEVKHAIERFESYRKPRILPIRVRYEANPSGLLLRAVVDFLQYSIWNAPGDTKRVLGEVLAVIGSRTESAPPRKRERRKALATPSPVKPYIVRASDTEVREIAGGLEEPLVIKAPWLMGKTSLLVRYLAHCDRAGKRTARIDMSVFDKDDLSEYSKFLTRLADELLDQFGLGRPPEISGSQKMTYFVRDNLLREIPDNVVLAFDNADQVVGKPYQSDFFAMLRNWQDRAASSRPEWARLQLAITVSTELHLLIEDPERPGFNVRVPVVLDLFNKIECRRLNRRYGAILSDDQAERLRQELLNGHPFFTHLAYLHLHNRGAPSLDQFVRDPVRLEVPFRHHLMAIRQRLLLDEKHNLLTALSQLIRHGTVPTDDALARLLRTGLIRREHDRVVPANKLFARFFGDLE